MRKELAMPGVRPSVEAVPATKVARPLLLVVVGLVAQLAFGAWWINAVTSLTIVWFLVKEGREAWETEESD